WRALEGRGQVELTCSPLYHPILPLVIDTDVARRAMPTAALPARFSYPQDAREQVTRGLDTARTTFGRTPEGLWPSEGAVSPEPEALVTLALDGENPWEHYPRSGEAFLDALYDRLRGEDVRTVLPREELRERPARARIERIHSGSWIDANYRIWIGHPEDNEAWTVLGEARAALAQAEEKGELPREQLETSRAHLLAAEGSDWFW